MSCTNNSVISANFISTTDTASNGRRLSFQQRTDTKWDADIAAGDVIRYDVDESQFVRSIADPNYDGVFDLSNAEVVGIVESISKTNGITYATVVIHGLMNYPGLTGDITNGGYGAGDIYFLSSDALGGISFGVEEQRGFIAKPVLQYCPVSGTSYNSIVINYLGYETSEAEQASVRMSTSGVGEIKVVDAKVDPPLGWIETSTSALLSVTEYEQAYETYGTQYGSYEELTINGTSSFVSSLLNKSLRPVDSTNQKGIGSYSKVISVDTLNNKIVVEHITPQEVLYKSSYLTYEILEPTVVDSKTIKKVSVTSGNITHFRTPKIETNLQANVNISNQILNFNTKTLLRVKPDTVVSYLPQQINFKDITISGTLGTPNITDVDSKIISLENRIKAIEQKLGM